MSGDIDSEVGAGLIGGMGSAPSAGIGGEHALFRPCHGTAPDIAGKGKTNPVAMNLSTAMMPDRLGTRRIIQACRDAAVEVEAAVDAAFGSGNLRSYDTGGTDGTKTERGIGSIGPVRG